MRACKRKGSAARVSPGNALSLGLAALLAALAIAFLAPGKGARRYGPAKQAPEVDGLPALEVVSVNARERLNLKVLDGRTVVTDHTLAAEFGALKPDGVYVAPNFVPPAGLDTITLADSTGAVLARAYLQVQPSDDMAAPGTFEPGMQTSVPEDFTSADEYSDPREVKAAEPASSPASGDAVSEPADPEPATDLADAFDGGTGYGMPLRPPFDQVVAPLTDLKIVIVEPPGRLHGRKRQEGSACSGGAGARPRAQRRLELQSVARIPERQQER